MIIETLQKVAAYKSSSLKFQFVSDLHLEFADNSAYLKNHPLEKTQILSNQFGYISHCEHLRNGFNPSRYIEI